MTDAVERLRDVEANLGRAWRLEVADEIIRLRSDLARARKALEEMVKWVRPSGYAPLRYNDAVNMARAALTEIAH